MHTYMHKEQINVIFLKSQKAFIKMLTTDPNNILKKHITNKLGFISNKKEDPIIKN